MSGTHERNTRAPSPQGERHSTHVRARTGIVAGVIGGRAVAIRGVSARAHPTPTRATTPPLLATPAAASCCGTVATAATLARPRPATRPSSLRVVTIAATRVVLGCPVAAAAPRSTARHRAAASNGHARVVIAAGHAGLWAVARVLGRCQTAVHDTRMAGRVRAAVSQVLQTRVAPPVAATCKPRGHPPCDTQVRTQKRNVSRGRVQNRDRMRKHHGRHES